MNFNDTPVQTEGAGAGFGERMETFNVFTPNDMVRESEFGGFNPNDFNRESEVPDN